MLFIRAASGPRWGGLPRRARERFIAHRPRWAVGLLAAIATILCIGCGGSSHPTKTDVLSTTSTQTKNVVPPAADRGWLGLNYNSSSKVGGISDFAKYGIVYDRLGPFDIPAGITVERSRRLSRGLRTSILAGMTPDVVISPVHGPSGCSSNPNSSDLCLPNNSVDIEDYVRGFVRTVVSIRRAYRHHRIVFEPMDEPWDWVAPPGTGSGVSAADGYAAVLARLLPAAKAAGISLSLVYVPATGLLADGTEWIPDLYRTQPCLAPGADSCGPIEAWNLHPYGSPRSTVQGIASVPATRAQMRSGRNNIIISEIGFCATDVLDASGCDENTPTAVGSSGATAAWLTEALDAARRMHAAGWLRALIVWERTGGGWSMQLPDGQLTAQGRALIRFARSQSR